MGVALLCCGCSAEGETPEFRLRVTGIVTEVTSQRPVSGAFVELWATGSGFSVSDEMLGQSATDSGGRYTLEVAVEGPGVEDETCRPQLRVFWNGFEKGRKTIVCTSTLQTVDFQVGPSKQDA